MDLKDWYDFLCSSYIRNIFYIIYDYHGQSEMK